MKLEIKFDTEPKQLDIIEQTLDDGSKKPLLYITQDASCCGLKVFDTFSNLASLTDAEAKEVIELALTKVRSAAFATLTQTQSRYIPILEELGFIQTCKFENSNSGNMITLMMYNKKGVEKC